MKYDKTEVSVTLPTADWHVVLGWIESLIRSGHSVVPTAARDLAKHLREQEFPTAPVTGTVGIEGE